MLSTSTAGIAFTGGGRAGLTDPIADFRRPLLRFCSPPCAYVSVCLCVCVCVCVDVGVSMCMCVCVCVWVGGGRGEIEIYTLPA